MPCAGSYGFFAPLALTLAGRPCPLPEGEGVKTIAASALPEGARGQKDPMFAAVHQGFHLGLGGAWLTRCPQKLHTLCVYKKVAAVPWHP